MVNKGNIQPILKWAGGKRQLLPKLITLIPDSFSYYCEPFAGGLAMLFSIQPQKALVNDSNEELINVYEVIRDDVHALIEDLGKHRNEKDYYYALRALDRDPAHYAKLSRTERASRILFLNKTCYNGLFRVNAAGQLNVPYGRYKNPNFINADGLLAVSDYLNRSDIQIQSGDYASALEDLPEDSFVYIDPPYDPLSDTSAYTGYTPGGFSRKDQRRLRECCDALDSRGIKFMASNSATDFIKEEYASYQIEVVKAKRSVNCNPSKRGAVDEVVIRNYR